MNEQFQEKPFAGRSDEIYAMVSFGHKEREKDKNSGFFFSVYMGMVDAAMIIDPGIVVEWHGPLAWDPIPEIAAIRELTERRVSGIAVTAADAEALDPAINEAIQTGIPLINFDADSPKSRRLTFVGTNNFNAGYLAGQKMVEWLGGSGDVMVASIPHAAHLDARLQGFKAAMTELAPNSELHITYDFASTSLDETEEQMRQKYRRVTMQMLQEHPSIRGTFVTFAEVGKYVSEVVDALNLQDDIQSMAFDVTGGIVEFVIADRTRGVVGQDTYLMGYVSMILLHAAHHAPIPPTKEDGRWRISALQHFIDTHPTVPLVTTRKLRRIIDELEEHAGEDLMHAIDTRVEILEKDRIIKTITDESEDMRESLAAKIDALGAEIAVRKQAERELRMLNEELEERVERRTAEIARQKYILDSFMANIPDSVYFKDRDSRMIQINHAMAKRLDLEKPADVIGKTDFDFFPLEQAQPKFDREQEIIHHGKAVLALEEPDTGGSWSLTTKMPWRDEHGDIIGIFGISRDITELKQAQQQLEDAYVEIKVLNDRLEKENFRMSAELDVGRRLQEMVLPGRQELQELEGVDVVGFMRPADEIGGDYYDILPQNGRLNIGIGDVTGHGLESGVLMLMTQTAIRTLCEHGETDPVAFVTTLNRTIYKNIQRMGTDKTLTFALIHYRDGQLQLVGQHEEILVVRHSGEIERIDTKDLGLPIGLEHDITQWVASTTVDLASGDGIVLYTDGITEAENMQHEFYGIGRMCDVISRNWALPPEQIKQAVIEDVLQHIGEQDIYDDLTLVVLKQR